MHSQNRGENEFSCNRPEEQAHAPPLSTWIFGGTIESAEEHLAAPVAHRQRQSPAFVQLVKQGQGCQLPERAR